MAGDFASRKTGYKICLLLVYPIGLVLFIIGFATDNWTRTELSGTYFHNGLWRACSSVLNGECVRLQALGGWFHAVEVLQCFALAGLVISTGLFVVVNFLVPNQRCLSIFAAIMAMFSAMFGIIGNIVYGAKMTEGYREALSNDLSSLTATFNVVYWSYLINIAGLIIIFVDVILILIFTVKANNDNNATNGQVIRQPVNPNLVMGLPYTTTTTVANGNAAYHVQGNGHAANGKAATYATPGATYTKSADYPTAVFVP